MNEIEKLINELNKNKEYNEIIEKYIINTCKKRIKKYLDQFQYNDNILEEMKNLINTNYKYKITILMINIKNKKVKYYNLKGDTRKPIFLKLITDTINYAINKNYYIPDTTFFFHIHDSYAYEYEHLPFFIMSKPENKKGILVPDNSFQNQLLNKIKYNWDDIKYIVTDNLIEETKKQNFIYFRGNNTGNTKHNLRYKLYEEQHNNNIPLQIELNEKHLPLYHFSNYKYLLNLPGHQPWSYRFKYLFLMKSLVINICVKQNYPNSIESNGCWINFFDEIFDKDYVNLIYNWYEGEENIEEYKKLLINMKKIYNYYEQNNDKYIELVARGFHKISKITMELIYELYYTLIVEYSKKFIYLN